MVCPEIITPTPDSANSSGELRELEEQTRPNPPNGTQRRVHRIASNAPSTHTTSQTQHRPGTPALAILERRAAASRALPNPTPPHLQVTSLTKTHP
ncbi:hypothetical protein CROQUDRAFT_88979 [Cronartium quercuum f. sp. fusiforme G11]|uniref:Uncharacterized protein n=1 Tax=Cronartium quercuum f. sp. fusiforme G11 TaxID=708437 RepID=A0A9P6NM45_9BASI|nr:hypothetical protein CROQUDRAFT_88979 [Cronartium quercuum f. sp. fusiforme G11]